MKKDYSGMFFCPLWIVRSLAITIIYLGIYNSVLAKTNMSTNEFSAQTTLDAITFGNTQSETEHQLVSNQTQVITGALNQKARQCLPLATPGVNGGDITFTMKIDPEKRNYVTVKFWGEDEANRPSNNDMGRLYLYVPLDGVNYSVAGRHESDYAALSLDGGKAPLPGRFFYSTTMLPLWMTKGKTSITVKIVSTGRIYGLGAGLAPAGNYQYLMDYPSRGIYKAFSHTQAMLDVSGEVNGSTPIATTPSFPGDEVLKKGGALFDKVENRIKNRLSANADVSSFSIEDIEYLAKTYSMKDFYSYQNPELVKKVVNVIDAYVNDYYNNSAGVDNWGGAYGPIGYAVYMLRDELHNWLDVNIGYKNGNKTRREAWGDLLAASRDFGRFNRRTITNQSLIGEGNIYKANMGLQALGDDRAFSKAEALRYLKESIGLSAWLGNDLANGSSEMPYGSAFYHVTNKGLSRERGFLGVSYGEMQIHAALFYMLTGDEEFKEQSIKMTKARVNFRRPALQKAGNNYYWAMEGVSILAWRGASESDGTYAGQIAYGDRYHYTGGLFCAAATGDPDLMAYAKQMLDEGMLFESYKNLDGRNIMHLYAFDDYEIYKTAAKSNLKIPMSNGEPDFVWADEENAVVAIKEENTRLWITPYWQQKEGINGVARFHYSTSTYEQYGVLEAIPQFRNSGLYRTRSKTVDKVSMPDNPVHAYSGELLPIPVSEYLNPSNHIIDYAMADFYSFRFGKYLFGINTTLKRNAELYMPVGITSGQELISGSVISSSSIEVLPRSTKVIRLADNWDQSPVPSPPLMVHISSKTSNSVTLKWSDASGAQSYKVKSASVSGGVYTEVVSDITATTYKVDNIGQNTYFVVSALNENGESYNSAEVSINGYKNNPSITSALTAFGEVGKGFSYNISSLYTATSFSASGLPEGLSVNTQNGVISGTPQAAGTYTISISAKNSAGIAMETLTLNVKDTQTPEITSKLVLSAYQESAFGYKIEASNNPISYDALGLPAGFTIDKDKGLIIGTFKTTGTHEFSVRAKNSVGEDEKTVKVEVSKPSKPQITSASSVTAFINEEFSFPVVALYSPTSYSAMGLPPGLSIDTQSGIISGIPTISGTFGVLVFAKNAGGTGSGSLSIFIPEPVPTPWLAQDIHPSNVEMTKGYTTYDAASKTYKVNGAGSNIGASNDSFHFVYRPINGDVTFVARLATRKTVGGDKVGIMLRENNNPNSAHIYLNIDAREKMVRLPYRSSGGGGTNYTIETSDNGNTVPIWFKLERTGNKFDAYMSLNGNSWTQIGSVNIPLSKNLLAGMAVCSRNTTHNVSTFDNVSIKMKQTINFPEIEEKNIGDADFDPLATATSGLPVSYTSSDPSVALIANNMIHLVAKGTSTITASQIGNEDYDAAETVIRILTVDDQLGINDQEYANINIYPTAIEDYINIELNEMPSQDINLVLRDISGLPVFSQRLHTKSEKINLQKLLPGVYVLSLNYGRELHTMKIIKK